MFIAKIENQTERQLKLYEFSEAVGKTGMPCRILIIHNGQSDYDQIGRCLELHGYHVQHQPTAEDVRANAFDQSFDLTIADEDAIRSNTLPPMQYLKACGLESPLIVMSQDGTIQKAVDAVRMGASDYLPLSIQDDLLNASVQKALAMQQAPACNQQSDSIRELDRPFVWKSEKMQQLLSTARRIAASSATVLIQGESGSGKELLARYIHLNSKRCELPFVAMNCAALPENLAESELFGYKRGAFTGAQKDRQGKFGQANHGTLLLDEISELQLALQAKLLRVMQENEIDLIGGNKSIPVDVRCIATSNRELDKMVTQGEFREDLYYRLRVIPLIIPPLRDRIEDIPLLTDFFLHKYCPDDRKPVPRFGQAAMTLIMRWPWPGNVRELENAVQRALLLDDGPVIDAQSLLLEGADSQVIQNKPQQLVGMTVKDLERKLIGQTLAHVDQNRTHAAKMLGISIRTLRNKLREYQQQEEVPAVAGRGK
jgi:two-component system response regulator FlrC